MVSSVERSVGGYETSSVQSGNMGYGRSCGIGILCESYDDALEGLRTWMRPSYAGTVLFRAQRVALRNVQEKSHLHW